MIVTRQSSIQTVRDLRSVPCNKKQCYNSSPDACGTYTLHAYLNHKPCQKALLYAIENNWISIARSIIRNGAEIDMYIHNDNGKTPLHYIASKGNACMLLGILKETPYTCIDIYDNDCNTPLKFAIDRQNTLCSQILMEHGAVYHDIYLFDIVY